MHTGAEKNHKQTLVFKHACEVKGGGGQGMASCHDGWLCPGLREVLLQAQVLSHTEAGLKSPDKKTVLHQHRLYFSLWLS